MSKKYYITTPIYYANGAPHIGHAYTSLIADVLARIKRMVGYEVKFATGTDENGQKMKQSAAKAGKDVLSFLDEVAAKHRSIWDALQISYTDFIRTTEPRHHAFVQKMLQTTYDAGDIEQGAYEGLYCVGCEGFKKEADLVQKDGNLVCPDHLTVPDHIIENNWFFQLTKYQAWLEELYTTYPDFCTPSFRFNEIKSFVAQGLENFSISREGSDFGVPLPFDTHSVTYIWFDALYNYLTVCQGGDEEFWTDGEVVHVIGKDIGRFHAIFWPAMLKSSGNLPTLSTWKEIINGYFTVDGQKMSKSLDNAIEPVSLVEEWGRDALVYYLFSDIKIGNDGDFSRERFEMIREHTLKKGWGNLVARVSKMAEKNNVSHVEITHEQKHILDTIARDEGLGENPLWQLFLHGFNADILVHYVDTVDLLSYVRDWWQLVQLGNKFVDHTQPWVTAKEHPDQAHADVQTLLWLVKNIALLSSPFLLDGWGRVQTLLQVDHPLRASYTTTKSSEDMHILFDVTCFHVRFGTGYVY